jgi:nitroreductase
VKEIFERISIRKYENRPVEEEKIRQVLKAAMAAPSAGNQQPWEFYVVRDPEMIRKLADTVPLWRMECTKDPQAAVIARDAMSRQ